jgi:long-chain fatty acid transport protein
MKIMRKNLAKIFVALMFAPGFVFAGGLVTNTNQSASFTRNPAQDAVIAPEGVYYNPAGLVRLQDGFHLSLSNQTITQTREISSTFPGLNSSTFEGIVNAPLFPSVYAVYKQGRLAYSLGVNPIGGGGSANFQDGIASFETNVARIKHSVNASDYQMNSSFEGRSLNWGIQFNTAYALNEVVSLSLGLRYVTAKNSYNGDLNGVRLQLNNQLWVDASPYLGLISGQVKQGGQSIQPIIDANLGNLTIPELVGLGALTQQQADALTSGLGSNYNSSMSAQVVQSVLYGISDQLAGASEFTASNELDVIQTGYGLTPVIGLNFKFGDDLNFAIKYEHKTSITLTNQTTSTFAGLYPDKAETSSDMPALLALGASYQPTQRIGVSAGYHYYFDKNANYGKSINGQLVANDMVINKNFWEAALGIEFLVTRNLTLSTGYLRTQTGVNDEYHSDLSHSLSTNTPLDLVENT